MLVFFFYLVYEQNSFRLHKNAQKFDTRLKNVYNVHGTFRNDGEQEIQNLYNAITEIIRF